MKYLALIILLISQTISLAQGDVLDNLSLLQVDTIQCNGVNKTIAQSWQIFQTENDRSHVTRDSSVCYEIVTLNIPICFLHNPTFNHKKNILVHYQATDQSVLLAPNTIYAARIDAFSNCFPSPFSDNCIDFNCSDTIISNRESG